ncbi:MAG: hypothetical protein ABIF88_01370 [archaeon]
MKKSLVIVLVVVFFIGLASAEEVWKYNPLNHPFDISMSDYGSQVMVNGKNDLILFSSFDVNPPTAVWSRPHNDNSYSYGNVVSSKNLDIYLEFFQYKDASNKYRSVLRKYTSSSSVPGWEYEMPIYENSASSSNDLKISNDGQTAVLVAKDSSGGSKIDIAIFNGDDIDNGVPSYYLNDFASINKLLLSGDGSTLALLTWDGKVYVYDTFSGNQIYYKFVIGSININTFSISEDGSRITLAYSDKMHLFEKSGSTYIDNVLFTEDTPYYFVYQKAQLTGNGEKIIYSVLYASSPKKMDVVSYDVALDEKTIFYTYNPDSNADGSFNEVDFLLISEDDKIASFAFSGEYGVSFDELKVFDIEQNLLIMEEDLPGYVNKLDMSPDGSKVVVLGPEADIFYSHVSLFEIGEPGITMSGVPKIGNTVTFVQPWHQGLINKVVYSDSLNPMEIPPWGWLYPNRHTLYILPSGTNVVDKTLTNYVIPNNPALVGTKLYFQGFVLNPRDLTDNYLGFTVLPAG